MQTENSSRPRGTLDMLRGLQMQREAAKRLVVLGALCALVPPVGLVCLWRSRHVNGAVRLVFSALSLLLMTLVLSLVRPKEETQGILPTPVRADRAGYLVAQATATPAPSIEAPTIIYNVTDQSGTTSLETAYVYAADGVDSYYHASATADGMTGLRALTYAQAQQDGLLPCPDCYPPITQ